MAAVALIAGSHEEISGGPPVVRKFRVTAGTDATAMTHLGPGTPDIVIVQQDAANPTASEGSVTAKSATTVTLDFEDGDSTHTVYCWWYNPSSQAGASINQDNG
jgi:hypothetical protein